MLLAGPYMIDPSFTWTPIDPWPLHWQNRSCIFCTVTADDIWNAFVPPRFQLSFLKFNLLVKLAERSVKVSPTSSGRIFLHLHAVLSPLLTPSQHTHSCSLYPAQLTWCKYLWNDTVEKCFSSLRFLVTHCAALFGCSGSMWILWVNCYIILTEICHFKHCRFFFIVSQKIWMCVIVRSGKF